MREFGSGFGFGAGVFDQYSTVLYDNQARITLTLMLICISCDAQVPSCRVFNCSHSAQMHAQIDETKLKRPLTTKRKRRKNTHDSNFELGVTSRRALVPVSARELPGSVVAALVLGVLGSGLRPV